MYHGDNAAELFGCLYDLGSNTSRAAANNLLPNGALPDID
jgi:hypothetical protein